MAFGKKKTDGESTTVEIRPANLQVIAVEIEGTAPYVQLKFSEKAKGSMAAKQMAGSTGKASKAKAARSFEDDFRQAQHISEEGWHGIPATAFRAAMIDACRTVGLEMTRAKMAVFVVADGLDADDGTPLVRLDAPPPEMHVGAVRNATGVADLRARPMWRRWKAVVTLRFDADILTAENVVNLLSRAGQQVGVGEGRPFSKKSVGQGWGTFEVIK